MNWKMKWAYRALRIQDAADAVSAKTPKWVLETAAVLAGWLLIGGEPMACLWAFVALLLAMTGIFAVVVISMLAIRLLGFKEEDLERWALA